MTTSNPTPLPPGDRRRFTDEGGSDGRVLDMRAALGQACRRLGHVPSADEYQQFCDAQTLAADDEEGQR
jgi:hypothetical protein